MAAAPSGDEDTAENQRDHDPDEQGLLAGTPWAR